MRVNRMVRRRAGNERDKRIMKYSIVWYYSTVLLGLSSGSHHHIHIHIHISQTDGPRVTRTCDTITPDILSNGCSGPQPSRWSEPCSEARSKPISIRRKPSPESLSMILPQNGFKSHNRIKKQETINTLQSYKRITLMYLAGMLSLQNGYSKPTECSQPRLPHYHTGLVFEDEGNDENGNMLGHASPLHT